jgi:agmatinase
MGVPAAATAAGSRAAVLGIPFDVGTDPVRVGSRLGPSAIREQSLLLRRFQPPRFDFDPIAQLGVVDCGDVELTAGRLDDASERIEARVAAILDDGAVPVTMGGDGTVTLPQLRAVGARHPGLVVLHLDAHTDAYPNDAGARATALSFTRAAEEGVVDVPGSIHVGARGPTYTSGVFEHTRGLGYELISGEELERRGIPDVLEHLHGRLRGRPVYLCFDMDFFDPSCAPGVCSPAWGGATAREGLELLLGLAGLDFVAFDVNTVSPPHDVGGMTALLAATVMLDCLYLACSRPA